MSAPDSWRCEGCGRPLPGPAATCPGCEKALSSEAAEDSPGFKTRPDRRTQLWTGLSLSSLLAILGVLLITALALDADIFYVLHSNAYRTTLNDSFPAWWWPALIGLSLVAYAVARASAVLGLFVGAGLIATPFVFPFVTDFHVVLEAFSWPIWLLYLVGTGSLLFPAGMVAIQESLRKLAKKANEQMGSDTTNL